MSGPASPDNIQAVHRSPAVTEALLVHGAAFRDFPGATIDKDKTKALYASPMGHIKGLKPPFLILHGSADNLVSPEQSAQLFKGLKDGGNKAEYVLLEGANHGDLPWYQEPVIKRVVSWFLADTAGVDNGSGDSTEKITRTPICNDCPFCHGPF